MNARELFLAGICGKLPEGIPTGSPTSVATVGQMDIMDARFPEVHLDGEKMARLAAGAYEILGYQAIMPVFSVVQEAAAMGCEVDWERRRRCQRSAHIPLMVLTPSVFPKTS